MAKKKKKRTPHQTGISISRSTNKFTFSWKKGTTYTGQYLRYRTKGVKKWRGWTKKSVGKSATSYSVSLSNATTITQIQVQLCAIRADTKSINYIYSAWKSASKVYTVGKPPKPTLNVTNDNANHTTFDWSISTSDTNAYWYRRTLYRTKCTSTPDSSSGWGAWTVAGSDSYSYADSTAGTCRAFQMKAQGPAGYSDTVTKRHWITTAPVATWASDDPVKISEVSNAYYKISASFKLSGSTETIDEIVLQYYMGTPGDDFAVPDGSSWTDGSTNSYKNGTVNYTLAMTTDNLIDEDQCLWVRVKTTHDNVDSYSSAWLVKAGALIAPTLSTATLTAETSGYSVDVNVSEIGTTVTGAKLILTLYAYDKNNGITSYPLGEMSEADEQTFTGNEDLTDITGYKVAVYAEFQGTFALTGKEWKMVSATSEFVSSCPVAPSSFTVTMTQTEGKVFASWVNEWTDGDKVTLSWSDDPDAWESNSEPTTYTPDSKVSSLYITGLDTGTTWYFKVRQNKTVDSEQIAGPWSDTVSLALSSVPATPTLYLSEEAITEDDMVTAYWSYVTTDGTAQVSATIVEAVRSGDEWTYKDPIKAAGSEQHVDIYPKEHGWTTGDSVYLALQTGSASGGQSEYSTPVQLNIIAEPTVTLEEENTSLVQNSTVTENFTGDGETTDYVLQYTPSGDAEITIDGVAETGFTLSFDTVTFTDAPADGAMIVISYAGTGVTTLGTLPLTLTVGTTDADTLSVAIERDETYTLNRPDGDEKARAKGETVYLNVISAEKTNTISITIDNVYGKLDDGAKYKLIATCENSYGQKATRELPFTVRWLHQAEAPGATFETDNENRIAKITPVAPSNFEEGDTCDIYRLSSDMPELVFSGASFGMCYVDPYPAFGESSGYRIVTVTANGDYITPENEFAMYDTLAADDDNYTILADESIVIDFGGEQISLPYNISLDNSWAKDFERTVYLGGSVVGDWNAGVTRDLSAGTVFIRKSDAVDISKVRELANYTGICHVRTPDGSSFAADIQISETQGYDSALAEFSMNIQKVDTEGFDGMTYEDWSARN